MSRFRLATILLPAVVTDRPARIRPSEEKRPDDEHQTADADETRETRYGGIDEDVVFDPPTT